MSYRHRSPRFLPALLVIGMIRLALDLIDLILRIILWALVRICRILEAAISRLREEPQPARSVQPAQAKPQTEPTELDRLVKVLGRNDAQTRAMAADMLAKGQRITR